MIYYKLIYVLLYSLLISNCLVARLRSSNISMNEQDFQDRIYPEKITSEIGREYPEDGLKILISKILKKDSGDSIKLEDIESAKYWGKLKIHNDNLVQLFNVKLSYNLPSVYNYFGILMVDNKELNAYFLFLNSIEPIKIKNNDTIEFFAGRYKRKGYGIFKIYTLKENILMNIFTSKDFVSNFSLDCISYENDDLKMRNIDLNKDGLLDLSFTGVKNFYCEGLEEGYSREDRKPLKKEKITINCLYDPLFGTWVPE